MSNPERQGTSSDLAIVSGLKAGEASAMEALYERYSSLVYSLALRVLGDSGSAEDVLQEVFFNLWRRPALFDQARGNLAVWLAVITRNRAIDFLRKRRPETDFTDVYVPIAPDLAGATERSRVAQKVREVLQSMPAGERKILEMAYFEGLSHSQIADRTGEPLGTVKTRIRAGLIALRKAF